MTRFDRLIAKVEARKRNTDNICDPVWNLALNKAIALIREALDAPLTEEEINKAIIYCPPDMLEIGMKAALEQFLGQEI